ALGYSYLGLTSVELERVDSAIEAYQKAIELEPDSPTAYNNLAWFYAEKGINLNEAEKLCQQAIQISSKPTYIDTLAYIYYKRGEYEAALQEMSKISRYISGNPKYKLHWKKIQKKLSQQKK
ncbi:MAG TPA: tetratricopeptide repeat protein, partial [Flavobacteriales bacterium]|nr:tetratricopeptide repeat protein [Flavobacteriales bacterium]HIO80439.1 tetratricopeptide repeat protein [Candidatus Poribacteria bacterium]